MSVANVHHAISADVLRSSLTLRDLSDPAHGPHAMQQLLALAIDALRTRWECDILVHRASPVVSIADNYGMLGRGDDLHVLRGRAGQPRRALARIDDVGEEGTGATFSLGSG